MESKIYIDTYPKTMKMLGLERININCGNNTSIVTPANIAKDMIALLPDDVFIPESKFLDICCKSGIFLTSIRERLMNSKKMIESFPDEKERYKYITNNQLYGISPNGQCQMYSVRAVYGTVGVDNPHILCFGAYSQYIGTCLSNNHKILIEEMKKEFGQMKFDVVIGNPPYNKGMDLDFVDLAYKLSKQYVCMITPAKWQTAANNYSGCASKNINYKQFRELYVPHMSYVCFYPDALDIFHISQVDGLTYFLIDKDLHNTATVKNISFHQKYYNSVSDRDIKKRQTLINVGQEIVDYLGTYERFNIESIHKSYTFKVITNSQIVLCGAGSDARKSIDAVGKLSNMFNSDGQSTFIGTPKIVITIPNGAYGCAFSSENSTECESFISWLNCKFTRFFVAINISKLTGILTNDYFRFVPAPPSGKFDHIYTDEELYKAFNLPQKYIDIIEAVIKERK